MNIISKLISNAAVAQPEQKYPVWFLEELLGNATFKEKNVKEEYVFVTEFDNAEKFDYYFDVDITTNELIRIRAVLMIDDNK